MKEKYEIEFDSVGAGTCIIYNQWGGAENAERFELKPEDVWRKIMEEEFPAGRYYMNLSMTGTHLPTGHDFSLPPVKYCFMPRPQ